MKIMETVTVEVVGPESSRPIGTIKMPMWQYRKFYAVCDGAFFTHAQREQLGISNCGHPYYGGPYGLRAPEERVGFWKWITQIFLRVVRG
jgi:hypothetical protein